MKKLLMLKKSDSYGTILLIFMDKVLESKSESTVRICPNVTGQSEEPKTKLHLIPAAFFGGRRRPAPAAGMKPLHSLLRLIAGTHGGH